jgi:predicted metal-dependent phosphotriesterase family hydrolase
MEPHASGRIMTVLGPVLPEAFDRVLMHEHLHCNVLKWSRAE